MNPTTEQQSIIEHPGGHARVMAVAGSGKTATMVHRVRYLLENDVDPRRIRILMFNRDARIQFEQRMAAVCPPTGRLPAVKTFHAQGMALMKMFISAGFLPDARLITRDWESEKAHKMALMQARQEAGKHGDLDKPEMEGFLSYVDHVKSDLMAPADMFDHLCLNRRHRHYIYAYDMLTEWQENHGIRFYADLLYDPVRLINKNENAAEMVANHFDHIIADEYQDVNSIQHVMMKTMAGDRADVMAVGDVAQTIYTWRGSRPEFMSTHFEDNYPGFTDYQLSRTFRYGHALSLAANHLIRNNPNDQAGLCISPDNLSTNVHHASNDDHGEAAAHIIESHTGPRSEIAVLLRLFSLSVPVELSLLSRAIPYKLVGAPSVFEMPELKTMISACELVSGEFLAAPEEAFFNLLSMPHTGVTHNVLRSLAQAMAASSDPVMQLGASTTRLDNWMQKRMSDRQDCFRKLLAINMDTKAHEVMEKHMAMTKMTDYLKKSSDTSEKASNAQLAVDAMLAYAKRRDESAGDFVRHMKEMLAMHQQMENNANAVLITSIHRAKGLEWPRVIIPGADEGVFPYFKETDEFDADKHEAHLHDERRLFYVAMTRAINDVHIVHSPDKWLELCSDNGHTQAPAACRASRFTYEASLHKSSDLANAPDDKHKACDTEVLKAYVKATGMKASIAQSKPSKELKNILDQIAQSEMDTENMGSDAYPNGCRVYHPLFGSGDVKSVKGDGANTLIEISFPTQKAVKTLLLSAATKAGLIRL